MWQKILVKLLILGRVQNEFFNTLLKVNEFYIKFYLRALKFKLTNFSTPIQTPQGENFHLKILNEKDIHKLQKFFKYEFSINSNIFFIPHQTDKFSLRSIISRNCCIVLGIFHDDHLIGYGLITLIFPRLGFYAIFIADKWQGKGIGTAALKEQLRLIHDIKFKPCSTVNRRNIKSIKMLRKLGIEFKRDIGATLIVSDIWKQTQLIG